MKFHLFFAWYDFWIGWYWDRKKRVLYVCPLPMIVLALECKAKPFHTPHRLEVRERGSTRVIRSQDVTGIPTDKFDAIEKKLMRGLDPGRYYVGDIIRFPIETNPLA